MNNFGLGLRPLWGLDVYFNESMTDRVQVRFPRSKKRRLRKKWAKQSKNFRLVPRREIIRLGSSLHVHPAFWREFCKENDIHEAAADMPRISDTHFAMQSPRYLLNTLT